MKRPSPLPTCALLLTLLAGLAQPLAASTAEQSAVHRWCDDLGQRLHSVSAQECRRFPFVADEMRTTANRALVHLDVAARQHAASAPRVLVIGGIHGDELTSISIVFRWLAWLGDPTAGNYQWRFIPLANPDGLLIRPSTRVNGSGVDLNRNFATADWADQAQTYWTERTGRDPRRYPGDRAASENETRWLQQQIEDFKPQLIISVHAPYNLLDYDGPLPQPLRFGRLALNRLGVYPGSLGNYAGHQQNIPVITIELPHATVMPSPRDQHAMWTDMLYWMQRHLPAGKKR